MSDSTPNPKPTISTLPLSDGTSIPWLAYGTGSALFASDASTPVSLALSAGFTHLDGAQFYQNEASLGAAISQYLSSPSPSSESSPSQSPTNPHTRSRSSLYITTKLAQLDPKDPAGVEGSLRGSLAKLALTHVDLFLIHMPAMHTQYPGRLAEVWTQMVDAKAKGLTRSIGVSNFNVQHLEEIKATGLEMPVVNQIEYHPFLASSPPLTALLAFHAAHNITTASFGGLTPILPSRAGPPELEGPRAKLIEVLDRARERLGREIISKGGKEIGKEGKEGKEVSRNQVMLRWLRQKGVVAVTTSSKESRIAEYLATESLPALTQEEEEGIMGCGEGVEFRGFPKVWVA